MEVRSLHPKFTVCHPIPSQAALFNLVFVGGGAVGSPRPLVFWNLGKSHITRVVWAWGRVGQCRELGGVWACGLIVVSR